MDMSEDLDCLPDDWHPAQAVEEAADGDFEPIPDGWYEAEIEQAEMKPTKAGDGQFLHLAFVIRSERYDGRWVFTNINLVNPSEKAQLIGRGEFARLTTAVGFRTKPKKTSLLIAKRLQVKLKTVEFNGEKQNEVKAFRASSSAPPSSAPASPTSEKPASTGPKKNPWDS